MAPQLPGSFKMRLRKRPPARFDFLLYIKHPTEHYTFAVTSQILILEKQHDDACGLLLSVFWTIVMVSKMGLWHN